MTKKTVYAFIGMAVLFAIIKLFSFSKIDGSAEYHKTFTENYHVFALDIPKNMNFAGEKVPVNDFDVRERLDRELSINVYWQSQTMLMMKRANRWFPIIEPILKKYNVPDDFKFIALTESGLTNVVSPSGAVGFWQFIESTGKLYDLTIDKEVDERYDVEKSTAAACKYFLEAYQKLGNWTLVAASYNMGVNGVVGQLQKQRVHTYYDLLLNDETFRYVARLLAIKEIVESPMKYGFHIRKSDLYPPLPTHVITVDSTITNLVDLAEQNKTTYKMLKLLNPWLRQTSLTNLAHKKYHFKILQPGFAYPDDENDASIKDSLK
jgi:hypothetical protein